MLIEKNASAAINDIVSIRLATGEEIVAKLVSKDTDSITVAKAIDYSNGNGFC